MSLLRNLYSLRIQAKCVQGRTKDLHVLDEVCALHDFLYFIVDILICRCPILGGPNPMWHGLSTKCFFVHFLRCCLQVFLVGHDWGALVGWDVCLLRPDRVKGYVAVSVPFNPRRADTNLFRKCTEQFGEGFYMNHFQVYNSIHDQMFHDQIMGWQLSPLKNNVFWNQFECFRRMNDLLVLQRGSKEVLRGIHCCRFIRKSLHFQRPLLKTIRSFF